MSRRTYELDKNGRPKVPFHYEYTLDDWQGDAQAMAEDLDRYFDEFEQIQGTLPPGKPHPMLYPQREDDSTYQSELRIYENFQGRARYDEAQVQPQQMPLGVRVLAHGTGEDKEAFRARSDRLNEILNLDRRAGEYRAIGQDTKAVELEELASGLRRDLEKQERGYEYSFIREEKEKDLSWGKGKAEEMLGWSAEDIKTNLPQVTAILQGLRDLSNDEESYLLDCGSPFRGTDEASFRIVKVSHPGIPASRLSSIDGRKDNQGLLDEAVRQGWAIEGAKGEAKPEQEVEVTSDPEKMTQAEFEAVREKESAFLR